MSLMTQANASYVSDETVSVFLFDKFVQASPRMPTLFSQEGSSQYREQQGSMSGFGDFQEKVEGEGPSEDQPAQQFKKEFLHREWALGFKVDRKVYEDQNFAFLQKIGGKLGESAIRTSEKQGAAVFNGAFSSANYTSEDGLSLCNDAHVNKAGANSQDNAGSTAFGYDALGTTMTIMRLFTDYRGNEMMVEPDLVIHPVTLDQAVFEAIRSSGDPTEANLKANYYNGKMSSVSWSYLDGTSTTNWFLADSKLMAENLYWYWRIVLEMYGDGDAWKGLRRISGYYRSSHSAVGWWWLYGHNA